MIGLDYFSSPNILTELSSFSVFTLQHYYGIFPFEILHFQELTFLGPF